jgi:hypothetical protein
MPDAATRVTAEALIDYARALSEGLPMVFIEDLLDGDDWDGFTNAGQTIDRSLIVGDNLIVTNPHRLQRAVTTSAVEGFILKPNQVGTVAEALDCVQSPRRTPFWRSGQADRAVSSTMSSWTWQWGRGAVPERRRATLGRAHREAELPAARRRRHPGLRAGRRARTGAVLSALSCYPPSATCAATATAHTIDAIESAIQSASLGRDGAAEI